MANMIAERDWSSLPGPALLSVLHRLNLSDFFSSSLVCTAWSAASKAAKRDYLASHPPLLIVSLPGTALGEDILLYSLKDNKTYKHKHPNQILMNQCFTFSQSHYVVHNDTGLCWEPLLLNPITGSETQFPEGPNALGTIILSSSPTTSPGDCVLVNFDYNCNVHYCKAGDDEWAFHRCPDLVDFWFSSAVFHNGRFYAIAQRMGSVGREERFVAFDIDPSQATVLPVKSVPWPSNNVILNKNYIFPNVKQFLGDCQGELLMVFVCLDGSNRVSKCFVYRMDFSKWEWMQVKSLAEESLFVSLGFRSNPVISFSGMAGRGNCIYIGGYKNNMWSEYCLDDGRHTDHAVCLDHGCGMIVEEQCCLYNGMVSWVSLSQCFS